MTTTAANAAKPVPLTVPRIAGWDQIPDHVPKELIRSVGVPDGPEFLAAPHEFMARLHDAQPPVFYNVSDMGNAWQLLKHEDALFMLRSFLYGWEPAHTIWRDLSLTSATSFPRAAC